MSYEHTLRYRALYQTAFAAALTMLVIIPLQIAVYMLFPPPETVLGFFELFYKSPFLGLLSLDLLYIANDILLTLLYLAMWASLHDKSPCSALSALMLGLLGVACYVPSNPAFEMLRLSKLFFLAPQGERMIYLAAGEALMAGYTGTAFNVYYLLSTVGLLLFSYGIYKSNLYSRTTALFGFCAGFLMIIPSTAGAVGMIFSFLSLIPWGVFVALLMWRFKSLSAQTNLKKEIEN